MGGCGERECRMSVSGVRLCGEQQVSMMSELERVGRESMKVESK